MDKPVNLKSDYNAFFQKLESGRYFYDQLEQMIESNHAKAESEPESARDCTQRAKGQREILEHIKSVMEGGAKK